VGGGPAQAEREVAVHAAQAALSAAKDAVKRAESALPPSIAPTFPPVIAPSASAAATVGSKGAAPGSAGAAPAGPAVKQASPAAIPVPVTPEAPRPEMHYSAAGVQFAATAAGVAGAGVLPVGADSGIPAGVGDAQRKPTGARTGARRVRLTVSRINPWSVMKMSFLLSVAVGVMSVAATIVAWYFVDRLGTFDTIQQFINDIIGTQATFDITQWVAFDRVVSLATLLGVVNIVIMTVLMTIMAVLYNITASLVGGIHVSLSDD
jgi:hypothetical protein